MAVDAAQPIPEGLVARLAEAVGGWDPELETVAQAVYDAQSGEEFYDAERAVATVLRARADKIVGVILEHRAASPEFVEPAKQAAFAQAEAEGVKLKSHGRRPTQVRLLGGSVVKFRTLQMFPVAPKRLGRKKGVGRRGKAGAGLYPALAVLGIAGRSTPALRGEVARELAEANSVSVARASLEERGLAVPHKVALRLAYLLGERALEARAERIDAVLRSTPPSTGEFAGKRIVVSCDGGRLRVRVNPKAGRRNAKTRHRRYKAPWREPKILTIYVVDDKGQRDRRFRTFLDGTMGDADDTLRLMVGHLRLLGAHQAEHLTLVGDGAAWIWGRAEQLREGIGIPPGRFAEVVDYYHAAEHLYEVAAIPKNWDAEQRQRWVKRARKHLDAGRIDRVVEEIQSLRVGRRGKAVGKCIGYFQTHASRMAYADFRAAGITIGSGAVESGVRRVVNLRMKGNSTYWLEEHAEEVLHLRSHLRAGRWDDMVRAAIRRPVWQPTSTSAKT